MGDPKARRLTGRWEVFAEHVERWGVHSAVRSRIAWRLDESLGLHLFGVYKRPLSRRPADPSVALDDYTHRIFESADVDALLACAGNPDLDLDETFLRSALSKGDACCAVFHHGALVSYRWLAFTPTHHEADVYVDFGPTLQYFYKAFTLPEFRGHHAARLFTNDSDAYCLRRGRVSTVALVDVANDASIRYMQHSGWRRIGVAGYLRRAGLFSAFRTPGAQAEGIRFFKPS